jgi:hypothetical protein
MRRLLCKDVLSLPLSSYPILTYPKIGIPSRSAHAHPQPARLLVERHVTLLLLYYKANSSQSFHKLRIETENENDCKNLKVYLVSLHPSPFKSNSGHLLRLSAHLTREQRAASTITKPIQMIIRAKRDAGLRNISNKTIRLGKISKNTMGYPG